MTSVEDMKSDADTEEKIQELYVRVARLERILGEQRRHSSGYEPQVYK